MQVYAIVLVTGLKPLETFDQGNFLAKLISYVSSGVYQEKLNKIQTLLSRPDKNKVIIELGKGIEAFNSVPTSICAFLNQPGSFAQAVLYVISLGGDTDTIGAMTGAIWGISGH